MGSFFDKSWDEILLESEKKQTDWVEADKVNIYLRDDKGQIKANCYQVTQLGGGNQIVKEVLDEMNKKYGDNKIAVTKLDEYNTLIQTSSNTEQSIMINRGTCVITESELFNKSRDGDIKKLVSSLG